MFKNRFILIVGVLAALLVTMAVSNPSSKSSPASMNAANDFYQRHADWTSMSNNLGVASSGMTIDMMRYRTRNQNLSSATKSTDLSDYFLRHPELNVSTNAAIDTSDYFLRHPDWTVAGNGQAALIPVTGSVDLSDYYLRHPDLRVANNTAIDMSDYYLRHPELIVSTGAAIDTSDYFIRHPELSTAASSVDLSDYYLRHPELKIK